MIKNLMIGASALALSATAAQAQSIGAYSASPIDAPALVGSFGTSDTEANATNDPASRQGDKDAARAASTTAADVVATVDDVSVPGGGTAESNSAAGNTAVVDQDGNFNVGNIDQSDSTRGLALINQDAERTTASRTNNADIIQKDDGAVGTSLSNTAYIQQAGDAHDADITQDWQSSEAARVAVGSSTANSAAILQGFSTVNREGRSNDALIDQTGAGNDAIIAQVYPGPSQGGTTVGNGNEGSIGQTGVSNRAALQQTANATATANGLDSGAAYGISQVGDLNEAYVSQLSGRVTAGVSQSGDRNFAVVSQGTPDSAYRNDQNANLASSFVWQVGDDNTLWSEQNHDADQASSDAIQTGNDNYGEIRQFAFNTVSELTSTGDNNQAYVTQDVGASNSFSSVNQLGNNNMAVVYQDVASDYAAISQTGNSNVAHVNQ
jgi:hypothetical protein